MFLRIVPLLSIIYFSNILYVYAKHCDGSLGISSASKECKDDEICCYINRVLDCCTVSELWWLWTYVAAGTLFPIVAIVVFICSQYYQRIKQTVMLVLSFLCLCDVAFVRRKNSTSYYEMQPVEAAELLHNDKKEII